MAAAENALLALALASGGGCGAGLGLLAAQARDERRRRERLHRTGAAEGEAQVQAGMERRLVDYAAGLSRRLALGATRPLAGTLGRERAQAFLDGQGRKAGIGDELSATGFVEAMLRLALLGALLGGLLGCSFSMELTALLAVAGAALGAMALPQAIKRLVKQRAEGLEAGLSEMLEVVALGLRSGLSFDRSFQLYCEHFDSELARSCAACQRRWSFGLATREEALRELAASYDSALFERVVSGMLRSLRSGSSLAADLEQAAAESRAERRAKVEERVAKAPVKMMLPTAALILPAMLLLVLGPVLLELMEGI